MINLPRREHAGGPRRPRLPRLRTVVVWALLAAVLVLGGLTVAPGAASDDASRRGAEQRGRDRQQGPGLREGGARGDTAAARVTPVRLGARPPVR
jgi:hypothetical protein